MKKWNKNQIEELIKNYKFLTNDELSKMLDFSKQAIDCKAIKLGLKKDPKHIKDVNRKRVLFDRWKSQAWTKDDVDFLSLNLELMTNDEISIRINKSKASISSMIKRLGIKRKKKYTKEYIEKECLKYITKQELKISDINLYSWLYKNGKMNDVSEHMMKISYSMPQLILRYIMDSLTNLKSTYNDRSIIKPYEIDIYYSKYKFGLEYNGSYYHKNGEDFKINLCKSKGINMLIIDESRIKKKNFEEYVKNIQIQLIENLDIINSVFNIDISKEDIENIKIDKKFIFNGLIDIEGVKKICKLYNDYTLFIKERRSTYNKLRYLGMLEELTNHMKVDNEIVKESLFYLIESKEYYKIGDKVIIEYWYDCHLTVVKVIDIVGRKYKITHNISESKIFNAPDEFIKSSDIIDHFKP